MSSQATATGRPDRVKKFMSIVDKAALGMMYAIVIAVVPITAVGFLTRTV